MPEVSGSSCPAARLHSHDIPAPHWQPSGQSLPREMGMVLADPAKAEKIETVGFHRGSEARGPCSKHRRNTARHNGLLDMDRNRKTRENPSRSRMRPARPSPTDMNNCQLGGLAREERTSGSGSSLKSPSPQVRSIRVSQLAIPIVVASVTVIFVMAVGGWTTTVGTWYAHLCKPSWNPPNWASDRHGRSYWPWPPGPACWLGRTPWKTVRDAF